MAALTVDSQTGSVAVYGNSHSANRNHIGIIKNGSIGKLCNDAVNQGVSIQTSRMRLRLRTLGEGPRAKQSDFRGRLSRIDRRGGINVVAARNCHLPRRVGNGEQRASVLLAWEPQ